MTNHLKRIWDTDPDAAPKERSSFSDDTVGRFRSGRLVLVNGKETPESLNEWRVTTGDPVVAGRIAELMGGTPESWETDKEDNLQVLTASPSVFIVIEPDGVDASFKQFVPGAGLTHHCDGYEFLSPDEDKGKPCKCPSLMAERKFEAQKQRGPKPSIDITFRMLDAPELGIWRFNSGSWSLVNELPKLFTELDKYSGQRIRASLTIKNVSYVPSKGPRAGQTVSYNVPDIKIYGAFEEAQPLADAA
ncbi:recombination directionality factor [Streptomyces xanthophaeus]